MNITVVNKSSVDLGPIDSSIYELLKYGQYKVLNKGVIVRLGTFEELNEDQKSRYCQDKILIVEVAKSDMLDKISENDSLVYARL
jgi:hypothetical protein